MSAPYVFIGCSHEVTDQAAALCEAVQQRLCSEADIEVWDKRGVFREGSVLIVELEEKAAKADFAVFLVTETSRGGASPNVLFELGLFMGELERYRTMIVWDGRVELPADLGGVLVLQLDEGVEILADKIAENVENTGSRIRHEIELGSLERMINVCTPGYADHITPGVRELHPRPDGSERFTSAADFYEICRCLLHRYVIGSMGPEEMKVLRAYFAVFLGDGIEVVRDDERGPLRRCVPTAETADRGEATFVVALSNPYQSPASEAPAARPSDHAVGRLYRSDWRIGMPIPGYDGDRAMSTCATAFAERHETRARRDDAYNVAVEDEAEIIAIPVLWNERPHSASIGVLAISAAEEGLTTRFDPWVRRLRLVANVLGVAADRLSRERLEGPEQLIGIDVNDSAEQRSFARRAVAVRRAIADHAVNDLIRHEVADVERQDDEFVLVAHR